jgi:outer membrane receptor protein involved in Fe transport
VPVRVEQLLERLQQSGVDIIFSSELVPPDMLAPAPRTDADPMRQAIEALAAHGLELRSIAPGKFVVARAPPAPPPAPAVVAPMEEISVYASRYSIEGRGTAQPLELRAGDIEGVPGSHDDALRALKSLPGLASNASGRPYIRGSLADDVLVRYDGITLLDPFHLKNFQSLISAIDPAAVERIEVFSGGFPVRYGTRSGGVIDVTAPERGSGYENRANASLISAGVSTLGTAQEWPLEWLFALRRSTLDLLEPVEDDLGQPQFSDSMGRLRWKTDHGAWTLGWLLLDDQIELGNEDDEETADATYRDEYLWLARDHEFSPALRTRATAVLTGSERHRVGTLEQPGIAAGTLDSRLEFERIEVNNVWTYEPNERTTWTFGAEVASSRAEYAYQRVASYDPEIASGFGRPQTNDLDFSVDPTVFTYALHTAMRRDWSPFEAELGLRLDGQHYNLGGDHTQVSPRLNLRYDANERLRVYASAGRFTQAQHVEEWRVEEAQALADSALVSMHTILGVTFEASPEIHWGIEAYTKRWTTVAPYFDNLLNPLSLSPDLAPDRIRVHPGASEASGLELNLRRDFSAQLSGWGTLSWSRVADDSAGDDIRRSWDQPLAINVGATWQEGTRLSLSALAGWHRGWPRTPFELTTDGAAGQILLGPRNADRWGDFYTLDLRGAYTWPFTQGDLSVVLEITNATNRRNECCAELRAAESGNFFESDTKSWLPAIVNLGFSYRWRRD